MTTSSPASRSAVISFESWDFASWTFAYTELHFGTNFNQNHATDDLIFNNGPPN